MTYINTIIRVLEISPIKIYGNEIPMNKFRAQLPFTLDNSRKLAFADCYLWGNLTFDLSNYYQKNDFILIEGYFSPQSSKNTKQITLNITINRLYPFLFSAKY